MDLIFKLHTSLIIFVIDPEKNREIQIKDLQFMNLRQSFLPFLLKNIYFNKSYHWKDSKLFNNPRHKGLWLISSIVWY